MVYSKAFEEELFFRFEQRVDIRSLGGDFRRLLYSMERYAGKKWKGTGRQMRALADVAGRMGFENIPSYIYAGEVRQPRRVRRYNTVTVSRRKWRRKVRVSEAQKSVRYYVKRGYSANKIQRRLKKRGIGIRRKTLLRYVREAKKKSVKANREKYTPKKYLKRKK